MADDPKKPEDSQANPLNNQGHLDEKATETGPQDTSDTHTIISFLDHLAKRYPPQRLPKPAPQADPEPQDLPENLGEKPPESGIEANPPLPEDPDDLPPWAGQVVSLEEIRRLRQHAADANLPENPLLRYLFEHLMPDYHGGPVNLNVRPEFLQEHARPLLSLLLQSVADSLDGKRKTPASPLNTPLNTPSEPALQSPSPALQATQNPQELQDSSAPQAPPKDPQGQLEESVIIKKNVSFSLDLGKIFKQLFSGDKGGKSDK